MSDSEITQFTIFGERCSGTNHLQHVMEKNFDLPLVWEFGWKHFFCAEKGKQRGQLHEYGSGWENGSDKNTLFLCIVRNPTAWVNSLYRIPWHLTGLTQKHRDQSSPVRINEFLTKAIEFEGRPEIHGPSGMQYSSVMRMRSEKIHYMLYNVAKKVNHCIMIRHEDMLSDFSGQMNRIRAMIPARVKKGISFPLNRTGYRKKQDWIKPSLVFGAPGFDPEIEKKLGYRVPEGDDLIALRRAFLQYKRNAEKDSV
jgi:hypothetical protein